MRNCVACSLTVLVGLMLQASTLRARTSRCERDIQVGDRVAHLDPYVITNGEETVVASSTSARILLTTWGSDSVFVESQVHASSSLLALPLLVEACRNYVAVWSELESHVWSVYATLVDRASMTPAVPWQLFPGYSALDVCRVDDEVLLTLMDDDNRVFVARLDLLGRSLAPPVRVGADLVVETGSAPPRLAAAPGIVYCTYGVRDTSELPTVAHRLVLFRTLDNGQSWALQRTFGAEEVRTSYARVAARADVIAVAGSASYDSGINVAISTDRGTNWENREYSIPSSDELFYPELLLTAGGKLVVIGAANYEGDLPLAHSDLVLFTSNDLGTTWSQADTLNCYPGTVEYRSITTGIRLANRGDEVLVAYTSDYRGATIRLATRGEPGLASPELGTGVAALVNPARLETGAIRVRVEEPGLAISTLFDATGRCLARWSVPFVNRGEHIIHLYDGIRGQSVPPGVYFWSVDLRGKPLGTVRQVLY